MTQFFEQHEAEKRAGPLVGVKVIEIAGIGPAPFAGMLLSDLGADVIRVDRPGGRDVGLPIEARFDCTGRGRRSVVADLKSQDGADFLKRLAGKADVLIEGFRPGVMERLGLGPMDLLALNPRLVYGRVTGWGQTGPLAQAAGHDLNYIALSGALHSIGRAGQGPVAPLNLVGDYGGGALYLAFGVVSALVYAMRSGEGQVVDAAMCDGAASLMTLFYGMLAAGAWVDRRGVNTLDGGAPWYDSYETADERYVTVGPIEPKFLSKLLDLIGMDSSAWPAPHDPNCWPALRNELARQFRTRTREAWCELLEGTDACFSPVLSLAEAPNHKHNSERGTFVEVAGVRQPAPAPRFSLTPGRISRAAPNVGEGGGQALLEWGFPESEVQAMRGSKWLS